MNSNILPSDRARLVGAIDPDAYSTGAQNTGWIDASQFANFLAMISAGTLGASATLDAKIEEATDSGGTSAQDVSGKSITQLTKTGSDDDKQALINLRPDELSDGYTHFRVTMTVGTASSDAAAYVFGFDARYEPEDDLDSVAEVVE